jgi:hypothetical protein
VVIHGPPVLVGPGDDLEAKARELRTAMESIYQEADREVSS